MTDVSSEPTSPTGITKRIIWITLGLLFAQMVGTAFNIWYNISQLQPLLTERQMHYFVSAVGLFNSLVFPIATAVWLLVLRSISRAWKKGEREGPEWTKATQRVINLPWIATGIGGVGWLTTIPVLLAAIHASQDPLTHQIVFQLSVSVIVSALIAIANGFFAVEILTQRLLYPLFLKDASAADISGTIKITLTRRGMILAVSAVVCPILSLLLLFVAAGAGSEESSVNIWFPITVGLLGIVFGFASSWLLAKIVVEPVEALRKSSRQVEEGDLETHIDLVRTDEFGTLIDQFNRMVGGLREKRKVEKILGSNVGLEVARLLLEKGEALKGVERRISVMFTDIRGFTPRCSASDPQEVVTMLNIFFDIMVPEVERRRGIVNQFVGDGFMAIFGAIDEHNEGHEDDAVAAGMGMLAALPKVNVSLAQVGLEPLQIGVGVNSGPAVIGSVGATGRTSFTAIGDTVNVAARIESLTKDAGYPMLVAASTYEAMREKQDADGLEPKQVKGKDKPIVVYGLK